MNKGDDLMIRAARSSDVSAIWDIMEPIIREGETYALPREMGREDAIAHWMAADREVFVAERNSEVLGTYYLRANRPGGGSHVGNCGYMTSPAAMGRGVGKAMCLDSIARAKASGFKAIQFNFVVSTNERAVKLWTACGFEVAGRLPGAFVHPKMGEVDALVMFRRLV